MPKPRRKITLVLHTRGTRIKESAYAVREDKGGSRRLIADETILGGNWTTLFTVVGSAAYEGLDERWKVVDENGVEYSIERVQQKWLGAAGKQWLIYADRNKPRSGETAPL